MQLCFTKTHVSPFKSFRTENKEETATTEVKLGESVSLKKRKT